MKVMPCNAAQDPTLEKERTTSDIHGIPTEILSRIFAFSGAPALAEVRDIPSIREITNQFTPFELKSIGVPEDMNDRIETASFPLLKSLALNEAAQLTKCAQHIMASSPYTTSAEMRMLESQADLFVQQDLASNPHAPIDVLNRLAMHKDDDIRLLVAKNQNTPVETLETLAKDRDIRVLCAVAGNQNTATDTLATFGKSQKNIIKRIAVANPSTPSLDLEWRENRGAKFYYAENPNTPAELLRELAQDPAHQLDIPVLKAVVANKNMPQDALSALIESPYQEVRYSIARHPNVSLDALTTLSQDENPLVRMSVAVNPKTPVSILNILAHDQSDIVYSAVASKGSIPLDTLLIFAQDQRGFMRHFVAKNPITPTAILNDLAQDTSELTRAAVASNPGTLSKTLDSLAGDGALFVRKSVASHCNTSIKTLVNLAQDKNPYVANAAMNNRKIQYYFRSFPILQYLSQPRSSNHYCVIS